MENYKIKVYVEIVESEEEVDEVPREKGDGGFEFNISGLEAINIDKCEQALLRIFLNTASNK